jgi:ankyrin repeat protein
MDKPTIRKMENALMKMLLLAEDSGDGSDSVRAVTGDLVFLTTYDRPSESPKDAKGKEGVHLPPIDQPHQGMMSSQDDGKQAMMRSKENRQSRKGEIRDPFSDLKAAFEPPKEKLKTFNLKQIVTRNGTVLMNMLERLLDTTEIDARDVETEQTLLEFACQTGNVGLAKLCYRRGADLSARTQKGNTAFNIVTKNKRYDIMEFLHTYGVKVNSCDTKGQTALHIAASNDDVDAVCRLVEWGADVNIRDNKKQTPLHNAAAGGHMDVTMLLLEVGAEMNAKDEREYTPAAWAEARNNFKLMDRLVLLGGKGHGLSQKSTSMATSKSAKSLGELNVSPQMLKSSSLGRIGKVKVSGLPDPLKATLHHTHK